MKSIFEMLAEKDEEFIYHVHSTADIHDPERRERVRLEFMPYEIKSLECESYKPLSKLNTMFPNEPNSPTFTIKVITRYPLTKGFLENLASTVHIHIAHLRIEGKHGYDPVNKPEEVSSTEAQKLAGSKRIADFIKDLQDERKDRNKMDWTREVYETFFTTHRGLQSLVKTPIRNGYYMVEAYQEGGKRYLYAEGPFVTRPANDPYYDRIRVDNTQVITEGLSQDGLYVAQIMVEDIIEGSKN